MPSPALRIADETKRKPTARFSFTRPKLEAWKAPAAGRVYVWDTVTPGLACCITMAGARTYYHVRKVRTPNAHGKRPVVRERLGTIAEITIDKARTDAAKLNAAVADRINPSEVRKESERATRAATLFKVAFADYLADRRAKGKRTVDEMERKGEIYLGEFMDRPVKDITFEDVRGLHKRIADGVKFEGSQYGGKGAANRTVDLLSAVFNFARRRADNPCAGIETFTEASRERYLKPDEMPAFFTALNQETPLIRDYFLLSLFTGQRRGNVQAMRWDEIDLQAGVWIIPAAKFKTGFQHTVPLPAQAIAILEERKAANDERDEPSEYVFPSHRGIGKGKHPHLTEPKSAWRRVLNAAGLSDLRIHDLRHSLASWMVGGGTPLATIGKSLGHRQVQTTNRYAHLQLDPVRAAMNAATDAIEAASVAKPAKEKKGKAKGKGK